MLLYIDEFVVVESRAPQRALVHREAERVNEVQPCAHIGTQANHVARVRRYLRLIQNDVEHDNAEWRALSPLGNRG
jgi:hypothetical protein